MPPTATSHALFAALLIAVMGCDPSPATRPDPADVAELGPDTPSDDAPGDDAPRFLNRLESAADLATLTTPDAAELKYLAPVAGRAPLEPITAPCYFQNMRRYAWHVDFLRSFPELADLTFDLYVERVLSPERLWWGGTLTSWPGVAHPRTGARGIITFVVYADTDPDLALTADDLIELRDTLAGCAPFARDLLVLIPADPTQLALFEASADALDAADLPWLHPSELIEGIPSRSYSAGEGYGTLRVIPEAEPLREEDYGPRDVVITHAAPNDISLVSGLVTALPQNLHSHVNLRLQEKGVPNAAVPDIYQNDLVRELDGLLVHLVVTPDAVRIEPATLADAEAFWDANQPDLPELAADLSTTALTDFADLDTSAADAFGAKAANLAELHAILPPEHRPEGFAIPFALYLEFITRSGLQRYVDALLADPRLQTDAAWKRTQLALLRDAIRDAPLPADLEQRLRDQILTTFGDTITTQRLRFRSSTNVEDLDALTGAGLYDSRSGCYVDPHGRPGPSGCLDPEEAAFLESRLEALRAQLADDPDATWIPPLIEDIESDLTERKPLTDALRKVWASLWNERAFDERAFYGIDHRDAYMGVAVSPSFVLEQLNAVAITELHPDDGRPLYRLISQVGYESVVRPDDPTATPEVLTFRRGEDDEAIDVRRLLSSSLDPTPDDPLWAEDDLLTLARLLFTTHDHFAAEVYPHLPDLRLDVEIKLTRDDRVVLKQARPYLSGAK